MRSENRFLNIRILTLKYLFYSLRPNQWIKNLFIFLPLIFGKKLFIFPTNFRSFLAFLIFSIASGVGYLINDIMDLRVDKYHPLTRLRPLASGKINKKQALTTILFLGSFCVSASFMLDRYFGFSIIVYFIFNFLYTKFLKNIVIIDVFCIGIFFLLRIVAGTVIAKVEFSYWMILMSFLLSLFLGFIKRRQELLLLKKRAISHRYVLSKYNLYFIDQIISVITSTIVVVYLLYAIDERTVREFGGRYLLYTVPFVYYGIFRYLYLIHRLHRYGDPTHILLTDKNMQLNLILWIIVCIGVIYFKNIKLMMINFY